MTTASEVDHWDILSKICEDWIVLSDPDMVKDFYHCRANRNCIRGIVTRAPSEGVISAVIPEINKRLQAAAQFEQREITLKYGKKKIDLLESILEVIKTYGGNVIDPYDVDQKRYILRYLQGNSFTERSCTWAMVITACGYQQLYLNNGEPLKENETFMPLIWFWYAAWGASLPNENDYHLALTQAIKTGD